MTSWPDWPGRSTPCWRPSTASRRQQAQLISDAGHELRTPLTSLRTNIEVLLRVRDLPEPDRADLLADVHAQLEEMTILVGDLVELAREDEGQSEPIEVRFDPIVDHAIERARRRVRRRHLRSASHRRFHQGPAGPARAGGPQRPRQRRQMEPPRRHRSGVVCDATGAGRWTCSIKAPASPPTTCLTCSNASTGRKRPGRCRVRAWVWPSSSGSSPTTAVASVCHAHQAAAPWCIWSCRSSRSRNPASTAWPPQHRRQPRRHRRRSRSRVTTDRSRWSTPR